LYIDSPMLSKFARNESYMPFTYENYAKDSIDLKKYTIPELKKVAKTYKLPVSGTKPILVERIDKYFRQSYSAEKIQRNIRRFFVKRSLELRGEALRKRSICVNDTDFYTMEPVSEIVGMTFFSYKDEKGYYYGCDVLSLLKWLKQKPVFINPYNREKISPENKQVLLSLCKLMNIMHPAFFDKEALSVIYANTGNQMRLNRGRAFRRNIVIYPTVLQRNEENNPFNMENVIIQTNPVAGDLSNGSPHPVVRILPPSFLNTVSNSPIPLSAAMVARNHPELVERIAAIQDKPVSTRIHELFMEIDSLGNYTQASWFSGLTMIEYVLMYRTLYNIWNFQGIPYYVKRMICPLGDPFLGTSFPRNNTDITREHIQKMCLKVMEEMVFSGCDEEHRKLGALHVLRSLTMVSFTARQSLPWLYESMQ
jgi:SAP domain